MDNFLRVTDTQKMNDHFPFFSFSFWVAQTSQKRRLELAGLKMADMPPPLSEAARATVRTGQSATPLVSRLA